MHFRPMMRLLSITCMVLLLCGGVCAAESSLAQSLSNLFGALSGQVSDIDSYTKRIQGGERSYAVFNNRGVAYFNEGQYENAVADFDVAISIEPSRRPAYLNKAASLNLMGRYDEALATLETALTKGQDNYLYTERAKSYIGKGFYGPAIDDCNHVIAADSKDVDAYVARADAYRLMGTYDKSMADYNKAIAMKDKNADAYAGRGALYEAMGNAAMAKADYDKANALDPKAVGNVLKKAGGLGMGDSGALMQQAMKNVGMQKITSPETKKIITISEKALSGDDFYIDGFTRSAVLMSADWVAAKPPVNCGLQDIIKKYGEPNVIQGKEITGNENTVWYRYTTSDGEIKFVLHHDTIMQIIVTSAKYLTPRNIGIGNSYEDLIVAYGDNVVGTDNRYKVTLRGERIDKIKTLYFLIKNNVIVSIVLDGAETY